jgi:hypothetical protein
MIGRTKGWLWWLVGTVCAIFFSARSMAAQAKYGVMMKPKPQVDPDKATEEQKKQAGKLIDTWMAGPRIENPSDAEKARIAELIKSFDSKDYKIRNQASQDIISFGSKALGQLKEALQSRDAEVRMRSQQAISSITSRADAPEIAELKKIRDAAILTIQARMAEESKKGAALYQKAADLQKADRTQEAGAKRKEAQEHYKVCGKLRQLRDLVLFSGSFPNKKPADLPAAARYGIRVRPQVELEAKETD